MYGPLKMMAGRKYRPNEREKQVEEDLPWFGPLNYANDAAFLAPDYIRAGKKEKKKSPTSTRKSWARACMRPLRTGQRQVLNWFTTAGLAVSTSSSSQFFVQIFFFFFFYSVLKFTFSFLLRTCWRAWSRDLLPPLYRPAFKGDGELAIRRFLLIFKWDTNQMLQSSSKTEWQNRKKEEEIVGKKNDTKRKKKKNKERGGGAAECFPVSVHLDRVRTGNSVGCDIYTDWLWLLSLCYSIDSRRMSRQRSLFSLLLLLYFILIFFFPFFHFPFSPLKKPPLRHSMNIGWKRSRNSLRIIPPSTTTHTKFFEWVKQDNNEPIMK